MDSLTSNVVEIPADDPAVLPLITAHLELMRASSPACSVHAMEPGAMVEHGVRFFAVLEGKEAIAIGALKSLGDDAGEIKSMHVRRDYRGSGLAEKMLMRIVDAAREAGFRQLSLETGSQDAFAPARAFYKRHGFQLCAPFAEYTDDPASAYFTRQL
ncbi:MAG: GNAT family N-acetyltransferase [Boseongicola sp.]|nr:MAG: GNAT family N-acetyltransferase [Boseongicola sp.]